jgi:hypothetical protein
LSRLNEAKEKNGGKLLPYGKMSEVVQGLSDVGVHVDRNALNYLFKRYVKPVIKVVRCPLSVINVNMDLDSSISRLHAVKGAENLPLTASTKLPAVQKEVQKQTSFRRRKKKPFARLK